MAPPAPAPLQIVPDAADPALAQQQERFNLLVRDAALSRAALAEWQQRVERYHRTVEPVRRELHAAWRQWVLALDRASFLPGLSRAEARQLAELIREAVAPLLELEDDAELAALAQRHAQERRAAKQDEEAAPPDDDPQAEDWEHQAAAAAAQRAQWAAQRRAASTSKRSRQEEQDVSRSVRDVYRRLASALHPDREPDPSQRERKTALMQQANQAYADQNLLLLLELQLQAEQIDAAHLATVERTRLQHYVAVLQEQLAELRGETRRLEAWFRAATGLPAGVGLQPRKADRVVSSEAQRLRGELELLRRQARWLEDVDTVKGWLRQQRS